MALGRLPRPGNYAGSVVLRATDGSCLVSVRQYLGHNKERGPQWEAVPIENFFNLDLLRRRLQDDGLKVEVEFRDDHCVFWFQGSEPRIAPDGIRIKIFLSRYYGLFNEGPVSWICLYSS